VDNLQQHTTEFCGILLLGLTVVQKSKRDRTHAH